jgi:3-phytase
MFAFEGFGPLGGLSAFLLLGAVVLVCVAPSLAAEPEVRRAPHMVRCLDPAAQDQDDMCVWVNPRDAAKSTVICSDKYANRLFVYDLAGKTLQSLPAHHPGNIDVRYGFPLGGEKADIVAFNERATSKAVVYKVDAATGRLARADDGTIATGENYGGALYHSRKTGRFYFITTSVSGRVGQYELADDGRGRVKGKLVRTWNIGLCEAAVADDALGKLYISEEYKGVWEIGAEPDAAAPGKLVIKLGENGLAADVEGLALYYLEGGGGYLIVSNQSKNNFKVYRREGSHEFLGTFAIEGAIDTDGLEVINAPLGPRFPQGLFACHSDARRCPVLLTPWDSIAKTLRPPLKISTAHDSQK